MELELTAQAFAKLLDHLGGNEEQAGEKYENLRRTLIRFFEWRGTPAPEEHVGDRRRLAAAVVGHGVKCPPLFSLVGRPRLFQF